MGQALEWARPAAAAALVGVTGGASLALLDRGEGKDKDNAPQVVEQKAERKLALQAAKSRKDRLNEARGRSSFRIKLASPDPKMTRSGLAIG